MTVSLAILLVALAGCAATSAHTQEAASAHQHSDAFFQTLQHNEEQPRTQADMTQGDSAKTGASFRQSVEPPEDQSHHEPGGQYLVATGYGDLKKGLPVCQRVADTAARAALAKLIRVQIKEHATDRVRERTGQPLEQDIEVVREEMANELLQDVRIVERRVDRVAGTCSSTAMMPKGTESRTPSAPADEQSKP